MRSTKPPAAPDGSKIEKSDPVTTDLGRELDKQILDIAIRRGEIENLRRYGWAEIEKRTFLPTAFGRGCRGKLSIICDYARKKNFPTRRAWS